ILEGCEEDGHGLRLCLSHRSTQENTSLLDGHCFVAEQLHDGLNFLQRFWHGHFEFGLFAEMVSHFPGAKSGRTKKPRRARLPQRKVNRPARASPRAFAPKIWHNAHGWCAKTERVQT